MSKIKELRVLDVVLVTNTKKQVSSEFLVMPFCVLGIPFWETLRLVEANLLHDNESYSLRYLNSPDIQWEKVEKNYCG